MRIRILFSFFVLILSAIACQNFVSLPISESTETPPFPTDKPTSEVVEESTPIAPFTIEWLASLDPKTVLLQQDYQPSFFRMEAQYEFGREPVFILYADGIVVYSDEGETYDQLKIVTAQLSSEETLVLVKQVIDAGFQRLQSYTDVCVNNENGDQICVMDASITILRANQGDNTLKEVKIYADFANDKAAFETITNLFIHYTHSNSQIYLPDKGTLFLNEIQGSSDLVAQPWPLKPEILTTYVFSLDNLNPIVLSGQDLTSYLNAVPRNFGDAYFELNERYFSAFFVPWAPGKNYTETINNAFPQP